MGLSISTSWKYFHDRYTVYFKLQKRAGYFEYRAEQQEKTHKLKQSDKLSIVFF